VNNKQVVSHTPHADKFLGNLYVFTLCDETAQHTYRIENMTEDNDGKKICYD